MDSRTQTRQESRSQAYEASEDVGRNPTSGDTMGDIVARRYGRREILRGSLAVAAITAAFGPLSQIVAARQAEAAASGKSGFSFPELKAGVDRTHHVAQGYAADVLLRWGDPILPGAPDFDPMNQTAEAQKRQFGYNNDFIGFVPLPYGSDGADRGLLVVNHEYTNVELMFPGIGAPQKDAPPRTLPKELVDIEMAAHGGSVVEIRKVDGKWQPVRDSKLNRRITASDTVMEIRGPAAGHDRLKTNADPTGTRVVGTVNNCAGGITPWGTWLAAEENFHGYFQGKLDETHPEYANYKRLGVPEGAYDWGVHHARFDIAKEPNEPNRFGWIVEIDPHDPTSTPKKRTAIGRFKHEGAETVVNGDGRVVLYSGDDERFDYVYKFVTAGKFDPDNREANMDLLDEGTLHVAKFSDDGTGEWLPLVHGQGPLTAENGFHSQADVLINARLAGDRLGATKMDRPEDVSPNARTGKVYVMLTNNTKRKPEQVDAANPRPANAFGHIIEIEESGRNFAGTRFTWDVLVRCGDPSGDSGATFNPATTADGWFGMPDNSVIDGRGRLWISTDGNSFKETGRSDGIWAVETEGDMRGTARHFLRVPVGAEMCGPCFSPDDTTLFVAVQHPSDGTQDWPEFGRASTFEDPATRWPDFKDGMPPRPSVLAVTKDGGGVIGL